MPPTELREIKRSDVSRVDLENKENWDTNNVCAANRQSKGAELRAILRRDRSQSRSFYDTGDSKRHLVARTGEHASPVSKLEIKERIKTIDALKKALFIARKERDEAIKNSEAQISLVKSDLKATHTDALQRHLKFIDKLLTDKKTLAKKLENAGEKIKNQQDDYECRIKALIKEHKEYIEEVKLACATAEANRRKTWEEVKLAQIKQETIKGLEPEVEQLMCKHQKEIDEINKTKDVAIEKARQDIEKSLRKQFLEKQTEMEIERKAAMVAESKRVEIIAREKNVERVQKLKQELLKARSRLKKLKKLCKGKIIKLKETQEQELVRVKEVNRIEIEACKRKLENEIDNERKLRENVEDRVNKQKDLELENRVEQETKRIDIEKSRELEKKIDAVIGKMYEEKKIELEKVRTAALAEQESEIKKLSSERDQWKENYSGVQNSLQNAQLKVDTLQKTVSEREHDMKRIAQVLLSKDKEILKLTQKNASVEERLEEREKQVIMKMEQKISESKTKYQSNIQALEKAVEELTRTKQEHENEISKFEREKEKELDELKQEVESTLQSKEEVIFHLRQELEGVRMKLQKTTELLEEQRVLF